MTTDIFILFVYFGGVALSFPNNPNWGMWKSMIWPLYLGQALVTWTVNYLDENPVKKKGEGQ